jgi:alcohol dehydrogenase class IV
MNSQIRNSFLFQDFSSPTEVVEVLQKLSRRSIFLILDKNIQNNVLSDLLNELDKNSLVSGIYLHDGREPSTNTVDEVKSIVIRSEIDSIMGIGGGSTLDLMKAISVLFYMNLSASQAQGASLVVKEKLFSIAIPTTAGSGSEATKSAVLTNLDLKLKRGVNDLRVIPDVALLLPGILDGIPNKVFVASVFDGFTHAIESILGKTGSSEVKITAQNAIEIFLRQFIQLSQDEPLRIDNQILEASYFAGFAICNSETGPVHAISYPLSEHCNYGHGEAVGLLLPKVLRVYLANNSDFQGLLESHVKMPADKLIMMLEKVYSEYVIDPENLKPINDVSMLAKRSLELHGAINNSPLAWNETLSRQVLEECI